MWEIIVAGKVTTKNKQKSMDRLFKQALMQKIIVAGKVTTENKQKSMDRLFKQALM